MTPTSTLALRLARFALGLGETDLSAHRQTKLRLIVADFIGCLLAASTLPEADCAFLLAEPGDVELPGVSRRLSPTGAAIAMGTLGSLLQMHDGYGNGGNHPSNCIIPAVWCLRGDRPMAAVRMAVAVGYETANRIAASAHPALTLAGMAPSSATGAIGAAAALGRLLALDAPTLADAISNAAFAFPVAALRGLTEHGSAVPLHGGLAARCAIESVLLARAGLSAGRTVLEGGDDPGVLALLHSRAERLSPEDWRGETLDGVYFKPIPACRHAQPAIDAIESIWKQGRVDPGRIVRVDIGTYPVALRFGRVPAEPPALYDRLMSVTWAVASALRHGRYGIDNILAPHDEGIRRLCECIHTRIDAECAASYPRLLATRVDITLDSGEVRSGECRMEYGSPSETGPYSPRGTCIAPLDADGVRAKFDALARRALSAAQADALWQAIHADI